MAYSPKEERENKGMEQEQDILHVQHSTLAEEEAASTTADGNGGGGAGILPEGYPEKRYEKDCIACARKYCAWAVAGWENG